MDPERLSRELRREHGSTLTDRRTVTAFSFVALGAMAVVALYQVGILEHLPDPPLASFDSERIVRSPDAYARMSTPDAVLAIGSYAGTALLASMGGSDRARARPWLPIALAAKVGFDVYQAAAHSVNQWTKHRAFCSWCLAAAAASFATVPYVVPETRTALSTVRASTRPTVERVECVQHARG
jgi:hypothetical protein